MALELMLSAEDMRELLPIVHQIDMEFQQYLEFVLSKEMALFLKDILPKLEAKKNAQRGGAS
jgi:hypothetical protein